MSQVRARGVMQVLQAIWEGMPVVAVAAGDAASAAAAAAAAAPTSQGTEASSDLSHGQNSLCKAL